MHSLCGYLGKITFNPNLEQDKIVVVIDFEVGSSEQPFLGISCYSGTYIKPMEYEDNVSGSPQCMRNGGS